MDPSPSPSTTTPSTPNVASVINHRAVKAVIAALQAAGMRDPASVIRVLPDTAPTASTAAAQLNCEVGAIANSLVFAVDESPLLILTSGAHRVDPKVVAAHLGCSAKRLKRATPDFVKQNTGQAIGGVAPVGHPVAVRTLIDAALEGYPEIWAAAGHHMAVFPLDFEMLKTVTGGEVVKVN